MLEATVVIHHDNIEHIREAKIHYHVVNFHKVGPSCN